MVRACSYQVRNWSKGGERGLVGEIFGAGRGGQADQQRQAGQSHTILRVRATVRIARASSARPIMQARRIPRM